MMMSWAAPLLPPRMETARLGTMATRRVRRLRSHVFILRSRKPCTTKQQKQTAGTRHRDRRRNLRPEPKGPEGCAATPSILDPVRLDEPLED